MGERMWTARRRAIVGAVVLLLVVFAVYGPALGGGFLWDDDAHVTKPELRSAQGLWRIWTEPTATQQYYPLLHTAFWVQWWVWHDDPVGYHVVNVLMHALAALLAWRVLLRLGIPGAGLAAAIFAVHPVHVESVAWITELKNTLSGSLYLAAMLAYLRFDPPDAADRGRSARDRRWWAIAFGLFVCALLSKTVTASLPAALLVLLWWKRGTLNWRRDVLPLVPFLGVGAAMGLMTAWFERTHIGATGSAFEFSAVERLLIAGRVFWFYLGKLGWPTDLSFIYPRWNIDATAAWQVSFPVLAVGLVALLWWQRRRIGRGALAAMLFFGGTLFPVLGFFNVYPFKFSFVADHFQYLASLGIITLVAAAAATALRRAGRWGRPVGGTVGVVLVLVLATASAVRCRVYRDAETLWVDTTTRNPTSFMACHNLGFEYSRQERFDEAAVAYRRAIGNKPDFDQAWFNLGRAESEQGRTDEAIAAYVRAIEIRPGYAEAHYNLGLEYVGAGRPADAAARFGSAVAARPDFVEAQFTLGRALATLDRSREAAAAYTRALELRPVFPEAWFNLGVVSNRAGDVTFAIQAFKNAIALRPDYVDAHHNLAMAYARTGRTDAAADTFGELAQMLGRRGRYREALDACRRAIAARPDDARAYYLMGEARVRLGEVASAAEAWRTAALLDPEGESGLRARDGLEILSRSSSPEP